MFNIIASVAIAVLGLFFGLGGFLAAERMRHKMLALVIGLVAFAIGFYHLATGELIANVSLEAFLCLASAIVFAMQDSKHSEKHKDATLNSYHTVPHNGVGWILGLLSLGLLIVWTVEPVSKLLQ